MRAIILSVFGLAAAIMLSGCGADRADDFAKDSQVRAAFVAGDATASITIHTGIRLPDQWGGHTALLINGTERVIWDPAGTFRHPKAPEVGDVIHGITPNIWHIYEDYHVRPDWYVVQQKISVSREVADQAIRLFEQNGPASKGACAKATSTLLRKIPGFESIKATYFPKNLMRQIAKLPNVDEKVYYEHTLPKAKGVIFVD